MKAAIVYLTYPIALPICLFIGIGNLIFSNLFVGFENLYENLWKWADKNKYK